MKRVFARVPTSFVPLICNLGIVTYRTVLNQCSIFDRYTICYVFPVNGARILNSLATTRGTKRSTGVQLLRMRIWLARVENWLAEVENWLAVVENWHTRVLLPLEWCGESASAYSKYYVLWADSCESS
jgi:hypothetical protein